MQEKLNSLLDHVIAHSDLPIKHSYGAFLSAHKSGNIVLLQAPTGSGKTTMLPLLLLQKQLGKILVAVPRRIIAKSMANYLANILSEIVGKTVGYNVRLEHKASKETQILFVTFGILERMLLSNPELPGFNHIIFDEFHERSVSNDFSLALCLEAMSALRPELKLTLMSASLDIDALQSFLPTATLVQAQGRSHAIEIYYSPYSPVRHDSYFNQHFNQHLVQNILSSLEKYTGNILVFLPGQKEIARAAQALQPKLPAASPAACPGACPGASSQAVELHMLHSNIDSKATAAALLPSIQRKIILSSSIAESSLTLPNIGVVIDSGLSRHAVFSAQTASHVLVTQKASLSAIEQRAGRAGRTGPGVVIRLWDKPSNLSRPAFAEPEILQADLSKLLLDAAANGIAELSELAFLTPPPPAILARAKAELLKCGALTNAGQICPKGKALHRLNLTLALGNMVLAAIEKNCANQAMLLALMLEEPRFLRHIIDMQHRFELLLKSSQSLAQQIKRAAHRFAAGTQTIELDAALMAELFLSACPNMLAKSCGNGYYLLVNGSRAYLDPTCNLSSSQFLIVAKLEGGQGKQRISAACAIEEAALETMVQTSEKIYYDPASAKFKAVASKSIGAIVLQKRALPRPSQHNLGAAFISAVGEYGLDILGHCELFAALLARIAWAQNHSNQFTPIFTPIIDKDYLQNHAEIWLLPYLSGASALSELDWASLKNAVLNIWPYELQQKLQIVAPINWQSPGGKAFAIDYSGEQPRVSLKAQELYGLHQRSFVGTSSQPLQFAILSPARRPIQITNDVPNFWRSSWVEVAKEMRARYPKHYWPLDPLAPIKNR